MAAPRIGLDKWQAAARERYGQASAGWRFRCPVCNVATAVEEWRDAGAEDAIAFSCIGRFRAEGKATIYAAIERAYMRGLQHARRSAPDGPLTGPVGVEEVLAEAYLRGASWWQRSGYSINDAEGQSLIRKAASDYADLHAPTVAARPADPEAQGAWSFDMEAAPRDGTPVPVAIRSPLDGKAAAGEAVFAVENQRWWWTDESYRDPIQPYAWFRLPEPPAPPSSGQGGLSR